MTPKKFLGRGAFDQRKGPHGGEFDQKNKKCQMPGGQPGGGIGTLGIDSYITSETKSRKLLEVSQKSNVQKIKNGLFLLKV